MVKLPQTPKITKECDFLIDNPEINLIFAQKSQHIGIIMSPIGEIIKSRRKEFGLTQARLAQLASIGINTLTQIERGEGNPTVKVLDKVLRTLGMQLTAKVIEL